MRYRIEVLGHPLSAVLDDIIKEVWSPARDRDDESPLYARLTRHY